MVTPSWRRYRRQARPLRHRGPPIRLGDFAEAVQSLQHQLAALVSGHSGDLDALGKGKGKKGGGFKGFGKGQGAGGSKGGGSKGSSSANINGTCWWCGVFGHRQSDCPALDARNGQSDGEKGGKNKGSSKGFKGNGKGSKGKGKGINEFIGDSYYDAGADSWEDWNAGQLSLAELVAEQTRDPTPSTMNSSGQPPVIGSSLDIRRQSPRSSVAGSTLVLEPLRGLSRGEGERGERRHDGRG